MLGLVTTSLATAEAPTFRRPSEQSIVVVPVQPPGASELKSDVPGGSVSTTCASATGEIPLLVTVNVYCTSYPAVTGSGESVMVVLSAGDSTVVVAVPATG